MRQPIVIAISVVLSIPLTAGVASAAEKRYPNCATMNADHQGGVGRPGAVDKRTRTTKAPIPFTVNKALHRANTRLDRDKDGIACERYR